MFPDDPAIRNPGKEQHMPPRKKTEPPVETTEEVTVAPPSDETDVPAAISRDTEDGKGDEPVPPSDFESFATPGVHAEEKTINELAEAVLKGEWGDYTVLRGRLSDAGHDDSAIIARVNQRMMRGAPAAYRASQAEVLNQIDRGEWGDNTMALESRLLGAGYKADMVADIVRIVVKR
jgi:hypothetical protein